MPTQATSVSAHWSCDSCGAQEFQNLEQLKAHEQDCRKRQRVPALSQASPSYTASGMPPYAPSHTSPSKMRRYRLLEPGEGEGMDLTDLTACQSLEVFEAGPQNVAEASDGEPITLGQIGIRCMHCLPGDAYSTMYPQDVGSIAACIQMLSDRHLSECSSAPVRVRDVCETAAVRRQRDHEHGRQPSEEEERYQMALLGHCRYLSGSLCLVDKFPPKTGVVVGDNAYRPLEARPEHFSHHPLPPRGPPHLTIPFQAPPPRVGQMMADIAATPLARRNKNPGADRDYPPHSFMPPTVDRNYSMTGERDADYAAFQPHGGTVRGYYAQDGHTDARTQGMPQPHDPPPPPTPQIQHQESPRPYPPVPHSPYEIPTSDFPFFQDMGGSWVCRYCVHVHPQYREPGSVWSSPNHSPPHGQFIDQHLSICRSYNQGPPPGYYDGPPGMPPYGFPPPPQYGSQYPPGPPPPSHAWGPHGHSSPFPPREGSYPPYMPPPSVDHPDGMYPPQPLMEREAMPHRSSRPPPRAQSSGMVSESQDVEILKAIDVLAASDKQHFGSSFAERESRGSLVLEEDKLLLTDYFYHLMRQLRLCRFSESDRKTRGGKRENIKVGYGGLQCVHCAEVPNSRKFFWSNVDRLANSFAEIPGHVLKCRRCPVPIKNALMELKNRHPEQMARLPRGSQKVFFRRMWRRLHDEDAELLSGSIGNVDDAATGDLNDENVAPKSKSPKDMAETPEESSHQDVCDSSDEGTLVIERSTVEAAKALADSANRMSPPSASSRILLAISEDKEWLSDMDCFIRRNLEVFCATPLDVEIAREDRKYPVNVGQVGIRCLHCAMAPGNDAARGTAVAFPFSINGIYEAVREFQRLHLESCPHCPDSAKAKLAGFKGSASLSSVLRKFYVLGARALGMHDTPDGIRPGSESVPLGSSAASAFSFHDTSSMPGRGKVGGDQAQANGGDSAFLHTAITPLESRRKKRSLSADETKSDESPKKARAV